MLTELIGSAWEIVDIEIFDEGQKVISLGSLPFTEPQEISAQAVSRSSFSQKPYPRRSL
jgi:hypothetical protein